MLNKVILMGRLTASPELKQTQGGTAVTSFSIAVDRNFTDKDGNKTTDFINIAAWRQTAEFVCKYFDKGKLIALEGSIQVRNYEDKQGNKRTAVEVLADHVYFAGGTCGAADAPTVVKASTQGSASGGSASGFSVGDFEEVDGDEFPF